MTSNINGLVGTYKVDNTNLLKDNIHLRICKRKNVTASKPTYFIVDRTDQDTKGKYISSLYPLSDLTYKMDYNGVQYHLNMSGDGTAEINSLHTISREL